MCMIINFEKTNRALNRKKTVIRYKVLGATKDGKTLKSAIYSDFHWKRGMNKAKGTHRGVAEVVGGAIHVYTNRKAALNWLYDKDPECIVKVECDPRDLIAVGNDGDEAYKQVKLPKEEYNRAIKEIKELIKIG